MNPNAGEGYFIRPILLCPVRLKAAEQRDRACYFWATDPQFKKLQRRLDFWAFSLCSIIKAQTDLIDDMLIYADAFLNNPLGAGTNDPHDKVGTKFNIRIGHQWTLWFALARCLRIIIRDTQKLFRDNIGDWHEQTCLRFRLRQSTATLYQYTRFCGEDINTLWDLIWDRAPNPVMKFLVLASRGMPVNGIRLTPRDRRNTLLRFIMLRLTRRRGWEPIKWDLYQKRMPKNPIFTNPVEFFAEKMAPILMEICKEVSEGYPRDLAETLI